MDVCYSTKTRQRAGLGIEFGHSPHFALVRLRARFLSMTVLTALSVTAKAAII
jgi:hypothetical protein